MALTRFAAAFRKPLAALFLIAVFVASAAAQKQPKWISKKLDGFVEKAMSDWQVPGLALAVVQNGEIVLTRCYGVRQLGQPTPIDVHTRFKVASNSKAFTGLACSILEEEGALSLDDRASRWLPDFKLRDECASELVTVRDLLCHRLGFETFQGDMTFWAGQMPRALVIEKMRYLKPKYGFRTKFGYCNSAFATAGAVIEKASGKPWEVFVAERFFEKIRMADAVALSNDLKSSGDFAWPHTFDADGKLIWVESQNIDNMAPAGSICASIDDMARWILFQLDTGRVEGRQAMPQKAVLKTWSANTIVNPNGPTAYGLGWFIDRFEGRKRLSHTGGADGFVTATCFLPEEKLGVVVLTNTDQNELFTALRDHLLEAYLGLPQGQHHQKALKNWQNERKTEGDRIAAERKKCEGARSELSLEAYEGAYRNELYGKIMVIKTGPSTLKIVFEHHPQAEPILRPQGGNVFWAEFKDPVLGAHPMVFSVENGKVKTIEVKVNDFVERGAYLFEKEH